MGLLDYIPVVGTVKNTVECIDALSKRDRNKALSKGISAVVGGALDVWTLGTCSAIYNIMTKEGGKVVVKLGGKMLAKEGGKMLAKEGGKFVVIEGGKILWKEGGKVVMKEGGKILLREGGKIVMKDVGKMAAKESAKMLAGEVLKLSGKAICYTPFKSRVSRAMYEVTSRRSPSPRRRSPSPRRRSPSPRITVVHSVNVQKNNNVFGVVVIGIALLCLLCAWQFGVSTTKSTGSTKRNEAQSRHDRQTEGSQETQDSKSYGTQENDVPEHPCLRTYNGFERQPSRRGEHVINNDVLKVYKKILKVFAQDVLHDNLDDMINSGRLSPKSRVVESLNNPIREPFKDHVGYTMVVTFEKEYNDTNSQAYGYCIDKLRADAVDYMKRAYWSFRDQDMDKIKNDEDLRETVRILIEKEIFVDKAAKDAWLKQQKSRRLKNEKNGQIFNETRDEVIRMFQNLLYNDNGDNKVITWVKELINAAGQKQSRNAG